MAEIEKIIGAASRSFSVVEGFDFPGEPVRVHPKPKSRTPSLARSPNAPLALSRLSQIGYTGKVGTTTTAGKVM